MEPKKAEAFNEYREEAIQLFEKISGEPEVAENIKQKHRYLELDALCRFFVARECKKKPALKMYGDWIRWRAEFKADFMNVEELKP